jgi:hypothetical protein
MERAYKAVCKSQEIKEGPWDVVGDLMAASASPSMLAGFTAQSQDEDEPDEQTDTRVLSGGVGGREGNGGGTPGGSSVDVAVVSTSRSAGERRGSARGDLAVESAVLPAAMEAGVWPEDFDVSDHGPLTAVLVPRGSAGARAKGANVAT